MTCFEGYSWDTVTLAVPPPIRVAILAGVVY
jgi:hypothetical protein